MVKIVNTVTLSDGTQVTKTSTHRTYVVATVVTKQDGTQGVISWHLTEEAGARYVRSAQAQAIANYNTPGTLSLFPVTTPNTESRSQEMTTDKTPAKTAKTAKPTKAVTTRLCNCGCGEATSSTKTMYKPGHDARHAGQIGRDLADFWKQNGEGVSHNMLDELPSANLKHKAREMAARILAKATKKADKPAAQTPAAQGQKRGSGARNQKALRAQVAAEEAAHAEATKPAEPMFDEAPEGFPGEVMVGRWTYPARYADGVTLRNTKRDGSGEWVVFN